jgi:thiazole synthase ThiGH ThiG subunit
MSLGNKPPVIAWRTIQSRLLTGTGKFSAPEAMRDALAASGTAMARLAETSGCL